MSLAPKVNTYVDDEIARIVVVLQDLEPNSDEYGATLDKLTKLQKIRQEEKPDRASTDTLVTVAANLVGIALIIRHENVNVITSKAMSFIIKPKTPQF
jgi:hypothetical protein